MKYPDSIPAHAIPTKKRKKKQSPANSLTDAVIDLITLKGGIAYRINSQGQYDPNLGRFRHSGMVKGLPDVIGLIGGRFIGVEIKIGRDKMSKFQEKRQREIKESGGVFLIAKDIHTFKTDLNTCLKES